VKVAVAFAAASLALLPSCRDEVLRPAPHPVQPPVDSPSAIPDAPVNGTVHGAQFVLRDARYVVDKRMGFAHTDIKLSAGKSENPCGPIEPAHSTSVWLRLDGEPQLGSKDFKIAPGDPSGWTVHYQAFDERWMGVGEGAAIVTLREPGPDGRLSGGIAVCFVDDKKSCVSGSFEALSCPPSIDQPVRGAVQAEAIPPKYRLKMFDAGALPAAAAPDASAPAPTKPPPH
jgi:hypothetical protein